MPPAATAPRRTDRLLRPAPLAVLRDVWHPPSPTGATPLDRHAHRLERVLGRAAVPGNRAGILVDGGRAWTLRVGEWMARKLEFML